MTARSPEGPRARFGVRVDGTAFTIEMEDEPPGKLRVTVDGVPVEVDVHLSPGGAGSLLLDGVAYLVELADGPAETHVVVDGEAFRVEVDSPTRRRSGKGTGSSTGGGGQRLVAPMPGKVVSVLVTVGQPVDAGAGLVVLEAMKMENEFRAAVGGTVTEIHAAPGQAVNAGDLLVVVA